MDFIGLLRIPLEGVNGARGRTRTGTVLPPRDFKSLASTNFATRAGVVLYNALKFRCCSDLWSFPPQRHPGFRVVLRDNELLCMEAEGGIEPPSTALQAAA